jgi:adenine-specific DNA-methyltransferase
LSVSTTNKKIIYADTYFRKHINLFPNLRNHIDRFKKILTSAFAPYGLHRTREKRFFEGEGIFTIRKTKIPAFTYVNFPCYVTRAFMIIKPQNVNLKYLTGIFNSSVIFFWLRNKGKMQGEQLQIDKEPLLSLPIHVGDNKQQKQMIALVDKMLKLNLELQKTTKNSEKWKFIKLEIEKTDKKIDEEVYKLHELTPEEIKIIKENHGG